MNRIFRTSVSSSIAPLFFAGAIAATAPACTPLDDTVVYSEDRVIFPPTPHAIVPDDDVGLADDCPYAEPPLGHVRGFAYLVPPETRTLPQFEQMQPVGTICMDRLAVTERRTFPGLRNRGEWFGIGFDGAFTVTTPGRFRFRLTSDDGSQLYIDSALVIDNDGYHATRAAEGAVYLTAGAHRINVPYWQGPGPLSLVLEVAPEAADYAVFRFDHPLEGNGASL